MKTLTTLIQETLTRSYDLAKFITMLKAKFDVVSSSYVRWEPGRCSATFRDAKSFSQDDPALKSLMNLFNVFISSVDDEDTYPAGSIYVEFESKYGEDVTDDVYKHDVIYHLTKSKYVDKILKNGLSPRHSSGGYKKKSYHPERVYFLTPDADPKSIRTYQSQLLSSSLVVVDLKMLKEKYGTTVKFYKDPHSAERFSVYCDNHIRPEVLRVTTVQDEFKK